MRQGFTLLAASALAALALTPLVVDATRAGTATDRAAVAAPAPVAAAPAPIAAPETCARKVRVVYADRGAPGPACAAPGR